MITHEADWDSQRWFNFTPGEFACKSSKELKISPRILDFLQAWRTHVEERVTINSGYRSPNYNMSVSKTGMDGPHTTGLAVDLATNTQTQYQLLKFVMNYTEPPIGIGVAKNFTHVDYCDETVNPKFNVRPNVWRYT